MRSSNAAADTVRVGRKGNPVPAASLYGTQEVHSMYAVVEIKGKQYRAEKGAVIRVDRMEGETGTAVDFASVLMVSGDSIKVGAPYVAGASVKATIKDQIKGDKIIVFKYKSKKNYRRTQGHRQQYTMLTVEEIVGV